MIAPAPARRIRAKLALRLHALAGRIDPSVDFRRAGSLSLTLERGRGWVLHFDEPRGLPVWYRHPEYDRAHDDATEPV